MLEKFKASCYRANVLRIWDFAIVADWKIIDDNVLSISVLDIDSHIITDLFIDFNDIESLEYKGAGVWDITLNNGEEITMEFLALTPFYLEN